MLPTCRQHVGPTAKCRHIWRACSCRGNTKWIPTQHFLCRWLPTFTNFFSKYQSYTLRNPRKNWYVYIKQSVQPGYLLAPPILSSQWTNLNSSLGQSRALQSSSIISQHLLPQHKLQQNIEPAHPVLGACWGTEELGWNERSREEITRREITIKWIWKLWALI